MHVHYTSDTDRARTGRAATLRPLTAGVPVAIAGSIALALASTPAHAVGPAQDAPARLPGTLSGARSGLAQHVPTAVTPTTYTVKRGDTVSAIAARHGMRTVDVLTINGLSWQSVIYPGQVLRLSGVGEAPAPAAPAASTDARSYEIQAGDTISGIAERNGLSTQAVLAANELTATSIIYPGQRIVIPSAEAAAKRNNIASAPGLDAEQVANAQLIIAIGRELGVPDRGIAIALGTAMQESWLRNLDAGDRDSIGLFQQRPSAGWGTASDIQDPARSTRAFFGGANDPNGSLTRGLLEVPDWQSLTFAEAAQAVQISAYPDRYAQWEQPATAWLAALG